MTIYHHFLYNLTIFVQRKLQPCLSHDSMIKRFLCSNLMGSHRCKTVNIMEYVIQLLILHKVDAICLMCERNYLLLLVLPIKMYIISNIVILEHASRFLGDHPTLIFFCLPFLYKSKLFLLNFRPSPYKKVNHFKHFCKYASSLFGSDKERPSLTVSLLMLRYKSMF